MLYIFDKDDNLLEIIEDYSDDELTRDIKGTFTFSFKYKVNATENIKKRNKVGFFIDDEKKDNFRLFIIDEVEECYFNDEELYVYCINDYYSLKDNVIIDKRCNNYNVEQTLEKVLENTSYALGDTINLGTKTLSFYYVSSLEAFNNTRETYRFEFDTRIEFNEDYTKINHKYIDIKYRLGQDTGLRFTYDTNLTKVKRTIPSENHYNVLYGRGASLETDEGGYTRLLDFADVSDTDKNKPLGQKYVEDINSIAKYGRIEGIYENKDIKDSTELLNATWGKLQETKEPQVTYEAEAEDIRDIEGFEHYNANLGDSIIILDEDYKLDYESRIIKDIISIKNKTHKITLGYILPSMTDSIGGIVVNSSDKENIKVNDTNFPNTLPTIPILSMENEGFATLSLSWTFENKSYYTYILYASQLENFNPTEDNIIWQGQGSSFLHEVNFNETWYYRIRAKNTHNQYTDFSNQVTGTTYKISDATQVFKEAAIKDALIANLRADRAWVGKFKGDYIDARNLSVTDGNGKKTVDIDSFGNVNLDVTSLKISGKKATTVGDLNTLKEELSVTHESIRNEMANMKTGLDTDIQNAKQATSDLNTYVNNAFKDSVLSDYELSMLKDKINKANEEKVDVDNEYHNVLSNINLVDDALKKKLSSAKDNYDLNYKNLIDTINNATKDVLAGELTDLVKIKDKIFTRVFRGKVLGGTTVPQSFDIDFNKGIIYVAQVRTALTGDVRINRVDMSGKLLDNMIVSNSGHGSNIAFDGEYIYMEAVPYYTESTNMSHGTKIGRIRYQAGTTIDMSTCEQFDPLPTHKGLVPTLFDNNSKICIKSSYNNLEYYSVYDFNNFKNKVYTPLYQFTRAKTVTSWQGFSVDNNIIYIYEGQSENIASRKIHAYSINGTHLYSENININDVLSFGEPEGIKAHSTGNINTLYIGFADGVSGARNFNLYKLDKIKTDYATVMDECINNYVNSLTILRELLINAIDSIGDYKSYQSEANSKDYVEEKVAAINVTTDGISQTVNNIKKSHEAQYGDISRLKLKENHVDISSPNPGELYLYGVDDNGVDVAKGQPVRIVLQGKIIQFPANHLNPHYGGIDWGCPLNELIYIVYDTEVNTIYGVWSDSKSGTGWFAQDILGDNIITIKSVVFTWKSSHAIIGDFKLIGNEEVESCNLYKQACDSSLLKQLTTRSELKQTAESINLEVSTKVGNDSVISAINQTAEKIKIQANKISLEGAVTVSNESGDSIKINNADYEIRNGSTVKGFFGLKTLEDGKNVPRFSMGSDGISYLKHDYFIMQTYAKSNNPQNYNYGYVDMGFRCQKYQNAEGYGDVSNIKMYGDGVIRFAPIKSLEITTNFKDGAYNGSGESLLAEFGSSASQYYDKYLDIPTVRNTQNSNGLILAHRNANDQSCFVRVNCDTNGDRFFRPLTADGNVSLGSGGFPWKSVSAKTTYSSTGVVANLKARTINEITIDNALDNIEFPSNTVSPLTLDNEEGIIMDVTNLRGTKFIDTSKDFVYMDNNEMIKLLLKEVKQLKEEIRVLKTDANNIMS